MQSYGLKPGGVVFYRDYFFYSSATLVPTIVIYIRHAISPELEFFSDFFSGVEA